MEERKYRLACFGEPSERDAQSLLRDYLDGKISAAKIEADYGIDIADTARNTR